MYFNHNFQIYAPRRQQMQLLFCMLILTAAPYAWCTNLLRNASFEHFRRGVESSGYNRYCPLNDKPMLDALAGGVEIIKEDLLDFIDLDDGAGAGMNKEAGKGWRIVREEGRWQAFHGKNCLRSDAPGKYTLGLELDGWPRPNSGQWTFSLYVRGRSKDVIILQAQDIRGRKGEIRNDQRKSFQIGTEWQRCVFSFNVHSGPVTLSIENVGTGTIWVDALQLEEGKEATPFAVHPWEQEPPMDIPGHDLPLHPLTVQWTVQRTPVQYQEEVFKGIAAPAAAAATETSENGSLKVYARAAAGPFPGPFPVTGGIPLPQGHLFDPDLISVLDNKGIPLPVQTRVLSQHVQDGSIQMLLVDVLAPAPEAELTLNYGPDTARAEKKQPLLKTATDKDLIMVDTGALKFTVPLHGGNLFRELWFDSDGSGTYEPGELAFNAKANSGPWVQDPCGWLYWGGGAEHTVEIEENGPVRCAILVSGAHRNQHGQELTRYRIRIHAFAGQPYLRLEHVFSNEQHPYANILTGIGVRLPVNEEVFKSIHTGSAKLQPLAREPGETTSFVSGQGWLKWQGEKPAPVPLPGNGNLLTLSGRNMALTPVIREWDWMPPKEVSYETGGGLDLCVWPRHVTRGFCAPRGFARSHRLWLYFHQPGWNQKHLEGLKAHAMADHALDAAPEWYCESSVFGPLAVRDPERFPEYENFLQRDGEETFGRFPREGEYRWHDFVTYGDDRGDSGWGNMETMLDYCMWLLFVRSRDPWYYRRAHDAAIHYRDVDMCHPWGQTRVHSHNHTQIPWDCSHAWIKGVLTHYLLTGDNRSLEVAHQHGRWLRSIPPEYQVARGTRRFTRIIENLADLYRFTGYREYLESLEARVAVAEQLRGDNTHVSRFDLSRLTKKDEAGKPQISYGHMGFPQYYAIAGLAQLAKATADPQWKQLFLEEMRYVVPNEAGDGPAQTDDDFRRWGIQRGRGTSSERDRAWLPSMTYLYDLEGAPGILDCMLNAAFLETTSLDYLERYPNIGYAGQVLTAHAVYFAQKLGLDAEFEAELRGEAIGRGLPSELRDPDFSSEKLSAWASGKDVFTAKAFRKIDIEKDSEVKITGERSLVIRETGMIAETLQLDRQKRQLPLELGRNQVLLQKTGTYRLSGAMRFRDHGRPDIRLVIDGNDSGKRHEIEFNLIAKLPRPAYKDMLGIHDGGPQIATEVNFADVPELPELDETRPDNPEDYWWRFSYDFSIAEPSQARVILMYRFGLRPPGTVWFDDFKLEHASDQQTEPAPAKVIKSTKQPLSRP